MIVFVLVNLFQIIQILNERRKRHIEPKIVDLFETVFNSLTSYEFLTFWKKGIIKSIKPNSVIIKDGEQQFTIMLLLHGEVDVLKDNKIITYLSRGHFIGEISFISRQETIAEVKSKTDVTYIMWTKKHIDDLKRDNKVFWIKLQNILMKDMIGKIKRSND
jgi:CRP-like cAMP-binding protein